MDGAVHNLKISEKSYTNGETIIYLATGDLATVIATHNEVDGQYVRTTLVVRGAPIAGVRINGAMRNRRYC